MSKTDKERILLLESNNLQAMADLKELKTDNKEIKKSVEKIELSIASLPEKLAEKFDERYAPMIVKIIVFGMVGIILSTALIAILSKIIIK